MNADGSGRRVLTAGARLTWNGCVDTWSTDSRLIAANVAVAGVSRILIADTVAGTTRLLTPADIAAFCPLWAPDGRRIAFALRGQG